ncbi:MAG: ribbon-helix-helix domain-containing protein [Fervidobacterium sp.]
MKTIKISDETHKKLTATLGKLTAQTKKLQTYSEAIKNLLSNSVILPPELIAEIENFINKNKQKDYKTKEEFIKEAIRFLLKWESEEYKYIKIPKQKYNKLNQAVKEMNTPHQNATEFIKNQIDKALEQYENTSKKQKTEKVRCRLNESWGNA